ncbi:hypothetical protein TBLA_0C06400 [Henningerozyma blattae CBS 6284]|uniref:Oligomycin resistance ATP-dependent permease YOR1 n=1 Tax=Henningerozyma blattae (strain ATCC 34711 / CBS 6284 / DSM 70876 / NBRC 10599 / NRRL Y-10934 / UCD 77-7) TaxID=1071380 RepID=I2H231_HENB6|nr:hypothetical protein TBLA_0C06400 [Tetrapisispora blattae CBS 6284]CCH60433.1 hypothetical protein TBLA_0C06400 [Tetrapisispora blattae CBS 6284]
MEDKLQASITSTTVDSKSSFELQDNISNFSNKLDRSRPETFLNSDDIEKLTQSTVYPQKRLFYFLHSREIPSLPQNIDERTIYPIERANIVSKLFFWWVWPILTTGYKRTIQPNDLYITNKSMSSETIYERFQTYWNKAIEKSKNEFLKKNPDATEEEIKEGVKLKRFTLLITLVKTFKWNCFFSVVFVILGNAAPAFNPWLTKNLTNFVEQRGYDTSMKVNAGIGYCIGSTLLLTWLAFFFNHSYYLSQITGIQVRSVLLKAILNKTTKLSTDSQKKFTNGKINTFATVDVNRIEYSVCFQQFMFAYPVIIGICLGLLIKNLGGIAMSGVGLFFVTIIVVIFLFGIVMKMRLNINQVTDQRVSILREVLNNIKMVKLYCWEQAYEKSIKKIRSLETSKLTRMEILKNVIFSVTFSLPNICSLMTFLALFKIHGGLKNAATIFSSLSLFKILSLLSFYIPLSLGTAIDIVTSLDRFQEFLEAEESKETRIIRETNSEIYGDNTVAIKASHCSFRWDTEEKDNNEEKEFSGFHDLNFEIMKGELIIIVGPIGSGKTSLLNAICGLMPQYGNEGELEVDGSLVSCGYPWIQNTTVRDNILFGSKYDESKFKRVIRMCSLEEDLEKLSAYDMTEIGERGVTLSGGQKSRINLARSLYKEKDIYLFDDILSAVDSRVGQSIMKECLMEGLKNKTRVLATHQLSLIGKADQLIVLGNDGKFDMGRYEDLIKTNETLINLMQYAKLQEEIQEKEEVIKDKNEKTETTISENLEPSQLTTKEERAYNNITWWVYWEYIKAGTGKWWFINTPLYLIFVISTTFCSLFSSVWLSYWSEMKFAHRTTSFYMGMYSFFVFGSIVFLTGQFSLLCYIGLRASKSLNLQAVNRVIHSPMWFMESTPMGRIMNRFTKDTESLDNQILDNLRFVVYQACTIVGISVLCIIYLPWFAIAIPGLGLILFVACSHYQSSAREIKRLEAVQRSFIYNHLNDVLGGVDTIRAYGAEERFSYKLDYLIDKTNEASYLYTAVQRWINIVINLVGISFTLIVSLLCVTKVFNLSGASTGVVLSYVLLIPDLLNNTLTMVTQTENDMNSVERLVTYATELPQEASHGEEVPSKTWPENGEIKFENVRYTHRDGLPAVLDKFTLKIAAGERVGICGRTGAGKSTVLGALYRLREVESGRVMIDDVDVSKLNLTALRSRLAIIPQDPVLFQGSVRHNLDPFGEYDDDVLKNALMRCTVGKFNKTGNESTEGIDTDADNGLVGKFRLDQDVEENGCNFSVGERQVLALARALIRNSSILVLDEATAAVDAATDAHVQRLVAEAFKGRTVLCVAHRLDTILNYDRILVLENGKIIGLDTPKSLLDNNPVFHSMCKRAGITSDNFF